MHLYRRGGTLRPSHVRVVRGHKSVIDDNDPTLVMTPWIPEAPADLGTTPFFLAPSSPLSRLPGPGHPRQTQFSPRLRAALGSFGDLVLQQSEAPPPLSKLHSVYTRAPILRAAPGQQRRWNSFNVWRRRLFKDSWRPPSFTTMSSKQASRGGCAQHAGKVGLPAVCALASTLG